MFKEFQCACKMQNDDDELGVLFSLPLFFKQIGRFAMDTDWGQGGSCFFMYPRYACAGALAG